MSSRLIWAVIAITMSVIMLPVNFLRPHATTYPILELIGMLATVKYCLKLHKASPTYVYTSFYQIYSLIGISISLIIISVGTPMLEIEKEGNANGAFWAAMLFLITGLEAGRKGFNGHKANTFLQLRILNHQSKKIAIYATSFIVLAIGLLIFGKYGGAAFSGVTRVAFWNEIVPDYLRLYPSLLGQTFFLCAFLFLEYKQKLIKNRRALLIVFCYIFATVVIAGEKFSTFIYYMCGWLLLCAGFYQRNIFSKKLVIFTILIFSLLIGLITLNYLNSDRELVFLIYRIAMQGQLLWSVFTENSETLLFGQNWTCIVGCNTYNTGTDYISAKYLPHTIWDSYLATGSGLTGFMPALPILTLGLPIALTLHIAISWMLGILQKIIINVINNQDLVTSLLLFKIYFGLLVAWYASKESAIPGVIVTVFILTYWIKIFRHKNYNIKEDVPTFGVKNR